MSEKLIDGWEPDLPVSDGLLRAYVENYAGEMAAFAASRGGRVLRTDRYLLADHDAPAAIFNSAVLLAPAPADLPELADDIAGEVRSDAGGTFYLWSPWPTVDLGARGWRLEGHPTFAVRSPGGRLPEPRPDIRIERVTDPARLAEWEEVVVNGFPFTDLQPFHKGALVGDSILDDPRLRFWLAYDGNRPAAAALLHVEHGLAGFALGATLAGSRRKGLWYALVRTRLLDEPSLPAVSVFSEDSRPGAEAIGFVPVTRWTLWSRSRNGQAR